MSNQSPTPALSRAVITLVLAAALCVAPGVAQAHTQVGIPGGLLSGFLHPLTGADHIVAMVAVGIWGAQLGNPAIWVLPVTFPLVMALGGLLGILGVPLPATEIVIALSGVVMGAIVAFRLKAPLWVAAVVVGVFAIFHGHAHGEELPTAANPLAYAFGFVTATGLLHLCGISIGVLLRWPAGERAVRGLGVGIAAVGCFFLASSLGGGE